MYLIEETKAIWVCLHSRSNISL